MPRQQLENILYSQPFLHLCLNLLQVFKAYSYACLKTDKKKQAPKPFSKPKKRTPISIDLDELKK